MKKSAVISCAVLISGLLVIVVLQAFNAAASSIYQKYNSNATALFLKSTKAFDADSLQLHLDQGDTYMAISDNDIDGMNRWVTFYFYLETALDYDDVEVTSVLRKTFSETTIFTDKDETYVTETLIWTAVRAAPKSYNLTMAIIPALNEPAFTGTTQIQKIRLSGESVHTEFLPAHYIVEPLETLPGDIAHCSLATVNSGIQDGLTVSANYGITNGRADITSFALVFPMNFAGIQQYEVTSINPSEDDQIIYSVKLHFDEKTTKIVFRPFIKIVSSDDSGYIIPPYPTYITLSDEGYVITPVYGREG